MLVAMMFIGGCSDVRTQLSTWIAPGAAPTVRSTRAPATKPVPAPTLSCEAIKAEVAVNNDRVIALSNATGNKVERTIIAGIGGLVIPILVLSDDREAGTATPEIEALQRRQSELWKMAEQKKCNFSGA